MKKRLWTKLNQVAVTTTTTTTGMASGPSAGAVASNITEASNAFLELFHGVFYAMGIGLIVASILRYRDHLLNPAQTPISKPIFLLLAGLAVGFFPVLIQYLKGLT